MNLISMDTSYQHSSLEMWAGLECTINRTDERFKDQLQSSGHYKRHDDIAQFAALDIKTLRYPVLWERHQQTEDQEIDWTYSTERLTQIRENNIKPVVGLLHHGSGPAFTALNDPAFPEKFACYAAKVAAQFPWVEFYTPVNEPLTTARFSGLYGIWYPHLSGDAAFLTMLFNQLKGTVLAMQAIREINPSAKLVQTEDLSKTHSTPALEYQAEFENHRRWLTNDILCGRLDSSHPLWSYVRNSGVSIATLQFFLDHPCPPDIIGFNYYVTSERYLDEEIERFDVSTHGGNGQHVYADVEAVRHGKMEGIGPLLSAAWQRYQLPLAVTEVHLNCTREEQMRWMQETWNECTRLKKNGIDIRAITAWSLLGAYDWNSLLTRDNEHYESGVFAIRNNVLISTAMTQMVKSLASTGSFDHPLLAHKGWWHPRPLNNMITNKKYSLLIVGSTGTLGKAFTKIAARRNIDRVALNRQELNICNMESIEKAIDLYKPWGIINASGYVKVDDAEEDEQNCFAVNGAGPGNLASACQRHGIKLMTFSSDLVFDGIKNAAYVESDRTAPLNVYGKSKELGEHMVRSANKDALIIRTSSFFGPWDKFNFAHYVTDAMKNNRPFVVLNDVVVTPTYVPDLVDAALDLFIDDKAGIWHISNEGAVSWADFANELIRGAGLQNTQLISQPLSEMKWKADRPRYSALRNGSGIRLPSVSNAIKRYFNERTLY